jgi:hypothetical protein
VTAFAAAVVGGWIGWILLAAAVTALGVLTALMRRAAVARTDSKPSRKS